MINDAIDKLEDENDRLQRERDKFESDLQDANGIIEMLLNGLDDLSDSIRALKKAIP